MARNDDRRDGFDEQPGAAGSNGPSLFLILAAVVAVIAAAFVVQNREEAEIQYLIFFEAELRIWVAISFAIVLGILLDRLLIMWWRRSRRRDD